ncbi:MAG: hypothetical protein OEZ40_06920, partial [Candidatus Bathyarchaeota archaeon]|nr:hypothetical protein [Candidatus Bathyarchaeota archaeon]
LKVTEGLTLWQVEKGKVDISKDSLAVPIKLGNRLEGYVFHGQGGLLLDTIIETEEGAIGKPIEKELDESFLMLGNTEKIQQYLEPASKDKIREMKYENEQSFVTEAKDLLDRFLGNGRIHKHQCWSYNRGSIFAFPNKANKFDILIGNGSKIVYKAINTVFVSSDKNVVLKTPDEVILARNKKPFIIRKQFFP